MKVKAGVTQLEEAAALPASVNPFVCFDISALSNFVCDFWALKNIRQEGLGCRHLLTPFKLALSHVQGSCCGSPCSLQPRFWAKKPQTTFLELLELFLFTHWRRELRGLGRIWRTYCLQLQKELRGLALKQSDDEVWMNEWRLSLQRLELLNTCISRSTLFPKNKTKNSNQLGKWVNKYTGYANTKKKICTDSWQRASVPLEVNNEGEEKKDWSYSFLSPTPNILRSTEMHSLKYWQCKGWKIIWDWVQEQ